MAATHDAANDQQQLKRITRSLQPIQHRIAPLSQSPCPLNPIVVPIRHAEWRESHDMHRCGVASWCRWQIWCQRTNPRREPGAHRTETKADSYLKGQSTWLVNYAERYCAGLRLGASITEGTANFLVNRRMNKSQQMRWSRWGADLLLQVRCAVYNGTLRLG